MKNVKITVLRKQLYEDFAEEHLTDGIQPCDFYEVGDTFLYTGGEGRDAPVDVDPGPGAEALRHLRSAGATCTPWQKRDGVSVVCCTDGIRPVTFLLEALEALPG